MAHINKEHLEEISTLRNNLSTVVSDAGQLTLQIKLLESDIDELKKQLDEQSNKFKNLLTQEQSLIKRLSDMYGPGQINFETGEFTSEK
jgi:uncharacterized coiled-coil DUF342 family protein